MYFNAMYILYTITVCIYTYVYALHIELNQISTYKQQPHSPSIFWWFWHHHQDLHAPCRRPFQVCRQLLLRGWGELDLGLRITKGVWVSSRCPIFWSNMDAATTTSMNFPKSSLEMKDYLYYKDVWQGQLHLSARQCQCRHFRHRRCLQLYLQVDLLMRFVTLGLGFTWLFDGSFWLRWLEKIKVGPDSKILDQLFFAP